MQQLDARAGYSLAEEQAIIDFDGAYFHWRPYFAAVALAVAGAMLFCAAEPIVAHLLPLVRHLDPSGDVAKPELLLRPVYSLAIFLAIVAALKAALTYLDGRKVLGTVLHGTSARATVAISVLFVGAFSCFFLYALINPAVYARYFTEDGAFEDLTAIAYFACCVMYAIAFARYLARPDRLWLIALLMLFCVVFSLFIGLEEISYGQRIFGWRTPAVLEANVQQESNLHNLLTYGMLEYLEWLAVCALFGVLSALACLKIAWPRPWLQYAPDDSLLPLSAAIMILSSHGVAQEVMENSAALFAVLYAAQLLRLTAQGNAHGNEA